MSATNTTTNYSLPLFIGTDKPAWLVDWNGAMTDIDAQMKVNATAILANETAISGLSTTVSAHTTSISTISGQITTLTTGLNTAQGNINTIKSLIGNGTPTTDDKTLIGAINEIYGMITGGGGTEIQAANVSYDNTTSGLVATSVQAAIDEVYAAIPGASTPTAADVTYSNTSSGLTADDVQEAIDELNTNIGTVDAKIVDKVSVDVLQGYVTAQVKSGILFVNVVGYVPSGASWATVGTLPSGYVPAADAYGMLYSSSGNSSIFLNHSNGEVQIIGASGVTANGVIAVPLT